MSGAAKRPPTTQVPDAARHWGPAILVAVIAVATWQLIAWGFEMPSALLPKPAEVWRAAAENRIELLKALYATGLAAAAGLLAAIGLGSTGVLSLCDLPANRAHCRDRPAVDHLERIPVSHRGHCDGHRVSVPDRQ